MNNLLHPDFAVQLVDMWISLGFFDEEQHMPEVCRLTTEGAEPELVEKWRTRLKTWQNRTD